MFGQKEKDRKKNAGAYKKERKRMIGQKNKGIRKENAEGEREKERE